MKATQGLAFGIYGRPLVCRAPETCYYRTEKMAGIDRASIQANETVHEVSWDNLDTCTH